MAYAYSDLLTQARSWADVAVASGNLDASQAQPLLALEAGGPEPLFQGAADTRPLIVAFMGGTGVGKSSLLNRLAGQPVARAGVERPTSREVTLYHHRSLALQHLPAGLPLESIQLGQHDDEQQRELVWIDMPDFDSVELGNQRQVLQWLPHIDVLIYVVSPERYRDNKAWQLLLAEGAKHAWLFVMNQWDRGQLVQFDDFRKQLGKAGFHDPLLFRTCCVDTAADDFAELVQQLRQLSGRHNRMQLEQRNESQRRQQLQQTLQTLLAGLQAKDYAALLQQCDDLWLRFSREIQQGLAWPMRQLAQAWASQLSGGHANALWDGWARSRFDDLLDEVVQEAVVQQLSGKPLKQSLQALKSRAEKTIVHQTELLGRQALLNPGNGLQRFLLKLTAVAEIVLPLSAMAVVGYQVFAGYYHSAADATAYLGSDFAIHSVLLIGLSWLLPFFLHKKIQPSLEKAAYRGLARGLQQALATLLAELRQLLADEQQRTEQLQVQLQQLIKQCGQADEAVVPASPLLSRVLRDKPSVSG